MDPADPNYTFDIVSPKYGTFTVTAPERFRTQIEAITWSVSRHPGRAEGSEFEVRGKTPSRKTVFLHRFIWLLAGRPPTRIVDHRDGQPLNNAEDNLRAANNIQNAQNSARPKNNTSGYKGVSWDRRDSLWRSYIRVDGRRRTLGFFQDVLDAAKAYNEAAEKHFGPFARLNEIPGVLSAGVQENSTP